jgi:hypothetical protein
MSSEPDASIRFVEIKPYRHAWSCSGNNADRMPIDNTNNHMQYTVVPKKAVQADNILQRVMIYQGFGGAR